MKGRKILLAFIISAITLTSGCANGTSKTEEAKSEQKTTEENAVVPIKPITEKAIDDNPYMAKSDANVHQDCYNSDTTDEVLPVDIYPEINVSYEKVNQNASPAVFLIHMDMQLFHFKEDWLSVILMRMKHRQKVIFHRQSMMAEDM